MHHPPLVLALLALAAPLLAQVPAVYRPFGAGCSGQTVHPYLSSPKLPVVGRSFVLTVTNVLPNSAGVLIAGVSNSVWQSNPLPLNLGFLGAANCQLLCSIEGMLPVPTGAGTAFVSSALPNDASLVGGRLFNQFFVPDPRANPAGLAASNGAEVVMGDCLCLPPENVTESFQDATMLDRDSSGGRWSQGTATAPRVGGTGRHGPFDPTIGTALGSNVWTWNTDSMVIPARLTESGVAETVTNGVFEFSSFTLPSGWTVRFVGANPVLIKVRGNVDVRGTLDASGADCPLVDLRSSLPSPLLVGQLGARGGPGGGSGGQGGDSGSNQGPAPNYSGRNGSDVRLPAGHAYLPLSLGAGGKGSPLFPTTGQGTTYCALNNFGSYVAAGGSGGGFGVKGADGVALSALKCSPGSVAAPNPGGIAFAIGTLLPQGPPPDRDLLHYAVGGSGGGGGGSHALLSRSTDRWIAGAGGGGGGGIVALRVGGDLGMEENGAILCRGGTAASFTATTTANLFNTPAPGGGGSGGTVILQVDGATVLKGLLDTTGGRGGVLDNTGNGQPDLSGVRCRGGDGAEGYVRLEQPTLPQVASIGRTVPLASAANVGVLADLDVLVHVQSKVYRTSLSFTPRFLRYEIDATVNNAPALYTDDPALASRPNYAGPADSTKPLRFRIQGHEVELVTGAVRSRGPWRDNVRQGAPNSMSADPANAWRFQLGYDFSRAATIVVNRVTVWYQQ